MHRMQKQYRSYLNMLLLDHGVTADEGNVWGRLPLSKSGHRAICQLLSGSISPIFAETLPDFSGGVRWQSYTLYNRCIPTF